MLLEEKISIARLLDCMVRKAHPMRTDTERVNVVGVRALDMTPNVFNDFVCALWMNLYRQWQLEYYKATTDPGIFWLEHPENVKGTGILKEGHYPDSHAIGMHRGKYEALVQVGPLTVYRDNDRDNILDLDEANTETRSDFGGNIHRAHRLHESVEVDKWSALCQVVANPDNFERLMELCRRSRDLWGNRFNYTLINEKDLL